MPPMKGPQNLKATCRLWHGLPWVTYLFTWLAGPQSLKHIITSGRQSNIAKTARKDFAYTLHACGIFNSFTAKSDREMMVGLDSDVWCDFVMRINWWNFLELRLNFFHACLIPFLILVFLWKNGVLLNLKISLTFRVKRLVSPPMTATADSRCATPT